MSLPLAVCISGSGSNLQAIIDAIASGVLDAEIRVVVSNKPDAYGLTRAQAAGIPTQVLPFAQFKSHGDNARAAYDEALAQLIQSYDVRLVVLAGWMRILSDAFLDHFPHQVMNIHPALLPAFPGADGVGDALEYGVRYTGVTVHFVDSGVDTGPIILQQPEPVLSDDTCESLHTRLHALEHQLYPEAIQLYAEGRLEVVGRKVVIEEREG
jgi:phosphoribosylglycinamide formyltransferase-1